MKRIYFLLAFLAFATVSRAQLIISPPDTTICPPATLTLTAASATSAGIGGDDSYSQALPIGFTFNFYGNNYTQCIASSNGYISFNTGNAGSFSAYSITNGVPGNNNVLNSIMGDYADLYPPGGGNISYSTLGAAPNREFVVTWCNIEMYNCFSFLVTFQIILHETSNNIEFQIQNAPTCSTWNAGHTIQGVQDGTGTNATTTPGRNYPNVWSATNDGQLFTPSGTTSFTVTPIPFNFISVGAGTINWYANGSTFVGSGSSINVSPTTSTYYVAVPSGGCGSGTAANDTVFITVGNVVIDSVIGTNPTGCNTNDGYITVYGLTPATSYVINYDYNGGAASAITQTSSSSGTLVISNAPDGVYTNIIVSQNSCVSNPFGPITLSLPPVPAVTNITTATPGSCGGLNGTVTLAGLTPNTAYSVSYDYNGTAQPAATITSDASGNVVITGPAGTYDNIVLTALGCVSNPNGPATISDPAPPAISGGVAGGTTSCNGTDGTVTLSGLTAGTNYTVAYDYNGTAQATFTATADVSGNVVITGAAGTYDNIIVTLNNCSSAPFGPVVVSDPAAPNISSTATTNVTTCGGTDGSVILSGLTPGVSYTVNYTYNGTAQPAGTITADAFGNVTITGPMGNYSAISLTQSACTSNVVGPFVLSDPPPVVITASAVTNTSTCLATDGSITLFGLTTGTTYTLSYDFNGTAQPATNVTATGSGQAIFNGGAGIYSNIILTLSNCNSNAIGPDTIFDPAPIVISGINTTNTSTCFATDGSVILSGVTPNNTYVLNYTYNGVPATANVTADSNGVVTFTGAAGSYANITLTQGGCVSNAMGPVPVNDPPPIVISNTTFTDPTVCGNVDGSITLYGLDSYEQYTLTYSYNGVAQSPLPILSTTGGNVIFTGPAGNYTNIVLTQGGCISNTAGPIALSNPPLLADYTYAIGYACGTDTVRFTNTSIVSGNTVYTWSFGDSTLDTATNPVYVYDSQAVYTVLLTATNGACTDTTAYQVDVTHPLNAQFLVDKDTLCQGQTVLFTNGSVVTTANGQPTYYWYFGDGALDSINVNPSHTYDTPGVYQAVLVVKDFVPCLDSAVRTITVDSLPYLSFVLSDSTLCVGQAAQLTASLQGAGNTGYVWDFGDGSGTADINPIPHAYDSAGQYTITITASYRVCPDTTLTHQVIVRPYPHINLGPDTSLCPGDSPFPVVDYLNSGNPAAMWYWSTGDTNTSSIIVTQPGTYSATVSIAGCTASDTVEVLNNCYVGKPNVFTPNGDGLNDYWLPRQLVSEGLTSFTLSIFNRWGELIYQTTKLDGRGWDGRLNDVAQPQGVYIYLLEATFANGRKETDQGNLTLLR